MFTPIKHYCDNLTKEFDQIPTSRKLLLDKIIHYINLKRKQKQNINLVYICTHNSRRSHFGQVWAHIASVYYNIANLHSFSGGTETTAFNTNAINALSRIGFVIKPLTEEKNTIFRLYYDEKNKPIECFSKVYNHTINPTNSFAAIMTCGDAEENCPFIAGAEVRISTTYDDPKTVDNTPLQDAKYDEGCKQIALETFYVFSKLTKENSI